MVMIMSRLNEVSWAYAGLVRRGAAYLIDCVIAFAFFVGTQLLLFKPLRPALGIDEQWFHSGIHTELYTLLTISLPTWLYFALCEVSKWRATVGKRILYLQVVPRTTRSRLGLPRSMARTFMKLLPWELAHLTNNLPVPLRYAAEPGFRIGFSAVGLLMGWYMASIALTKARQAPYDLLLNTTVLKCPRGGV